MNLQYNNEKFSEAMIRDFFSESQTQVMPLKGPQKEVFIERLINCDIEKQGYIFASNLSEPNCIWKTTGKKPAVLIFQVENDFTVLLFSDGTQIAKFSLLKSVDQFYVTNADTETLYILKYTKKGILYRYTTDRFNYFLQKANLDSYATKQDLFAYAEEKAIEINKLQIEEELMIRKIFYHKYGSFSEIDFPIKYPMKIIKMSNTGSRKLDIWNSLNDFLEKRRVMLFFEPAEVSGAFLFKDGRKIIKVLDYLTGVNFFVTDEVASFLITYNYESDYTGLFGEAEKWIRDNIKDFKQRFK